MSTIRGLFARIAGVFTRSRAESDMRAELEAHLAMEIDEYVRRGMSPAAARRKALVASGGMDQALDAVRDQRGLPWVEGIGADLRYAVRTLRRNAAFTGVVVLTLALGIGANTAIFSVVRGVLLKPLPHRDGERLLYLRHSSDAGPNLSFSVPEVRDLRAGAPSLAGIAEYSPWFHTLHGSDGAIRIDVGLVTGNFFEVMGLSPVLGRLTYPSDDGPAAAPVMVLTHEFWQERFLGDSGVVGRRVRLDGGYVTVIGVMEPAPFFPDPVDALLNMVVSPHHLSAQMVEAREHRMTEVIARLVPGATIETARAEVGEVHARMLRENRGAYEPGRQYRVEVLSFRDVMGERMRLTLWLMLSAAGFVLIIATANVANLTLMRGVRREHELTVRAALGAGSRRLRRLMLSENLLLSLLGGVLGVLVALGSVDMLASLVARYSPRANEITLDTVVLGYTLGLSLLLAILLSALGSLPREGSYATISAGVRRVTGSLRGKGLQRGLVVAQVAVSVVLLAGAGLLTRTMIELSGVRTGLRTEEVLTMRLQLLDPTQLSPAADLRNKETYERIRRELRALPGVIEVGLGSTMPLRNSMLRFDVKVEDASVAPGAASPLAELRTASPAYFRAAGIPLQLGREFNESDHDASGRVAIINEAFAQRYYPGQNPIGRRVAFTGPILKFTPISGEWRTIVGVVGNTQDGGLDATPGAAVFAPFAQEFAMLGGFVIRAESDAEELTAAATRIVHGVVPDVPLEDVMTVAQIKDQSVSPRRLNAALISSFGILSVIIAAVGIAGVLAFSVSARTNEIGIRMSLGADRGRVHRMVLREGAVLLLIGLTIGVAGAFLGAGVIRGLLFGIAPHDPVTFIGVAILMSTIGVAACWIPAARAARIDPAITMRT